MGGRRVLLLDPNSTEHPEHLGAAAKLVCRSRSLVMSVNEELLQPFYCERGTVVYWAPPGDAHIRGPGLDEAAPVPLSDRWRAAG